MNRLIPTSIATAVFVFTSAVVLSRHEAMADFSVEYLRLTSSQSTPTPAAPTPAVVVRNIGGCGDPDGANRCDDVRACSATHGGRGRCKYYEGTEPVPRHPNKSRAVRGCACVNPLSSPTPAAGAQPQTSPVSVSDALGD